MKEMVNGLMTIFVQNRESFSSISILFYYELAVS